MPRKKIIDLVIAKKIEINAAGDAGVQAAIANAELAIAAVTGGINSPAWEKYMLQFVSKDASGNPDQEQLMRLLATDGTESEQSLIKNRAYLVSNGPCGEGTKDRFEELVKSIDKDIEADCEPTPSL
jgi:hypothetical protein